MQLIKISELRQASIDRPPGYLEEVMGKGRQTDDGYLELDDESYSALSKKYRGSKFLPGSLLSVLIQQITGKKSADCSECSERAKQMNAWGWLGCWQKRSVITQWLIQEAEKLGYKTDEVAVMALVTAAMGSICAQVFSKVKD
jgi:hypothetical protein